MSLQFFLPVFLLCCCIYTEGISEEHSLGILVLRSPQECPPGSQHDPGLLQAHNPASLAAELVNNRSDLLPGFRLNITWQEVDCSPYSAYAPVLSALTGGDAVSHPPVLGIVSATHPLSAVRTSALLRKKELTRLHLTLVPNQKQLPFSFSMLDTPDVLLQACIALIESSPWRRANVLYERLFDGQLPFNETKLSEALDEMNVSYVITEIDMARGIHLKRNHQLHLFFVDIKSIYPLLCAISRLNLDFPMYQFVFVIHSSDICRLQPLDLTSHDSLHSCTADEIALAGRGALILQYQLTPTDPSRPSESGLTYSQFEKLFAQGGGLSPEIPLVFDAVWALSLALNNSLLLAGGQLSTTSLGYSYEDFGTTSLIEQLQELSFSGMTGEVDFSDSTGHSSRDVSVYQFPDSQNHSLSLVGTFFSQNDSLRLFPALLTSSVDFFFACPFYIITPPKTISIISFVICSLFTLFVAAIHTLTLCFRRHKSVKASSYKLTQLTYVGSYLLILTAVINTCLEGFQDSIHPDTVCDLWRMFNSTVTLGLTFIFGSLSVRTWRLYRILVHFRKPGKFLSDHILLGGVFACVCYNLVVIIAWSVFDRFIPNCLPLRSTQDQGTIQCSQDYFFLYIFLLTIFILLLMILCMVFALLTIRKFSIDFHLRKTVCGVFWTMGDMVIGLPIYFMLSFLNVSEMTTTYRFMFMNLLLLGTVVILCVFILGPPLVPVIRERVAAKRLRLSTHVKPLRGGNSY